MEVRDMHIMFPMNYYMLRFDKAMPHYAFFSERKMVKTKLNPKITREINLPPILAVFGNPKINHERNKYAC